jgi:hypothetical protein
MAHICHRPITFESEWKGKYINNSRFIIIGIQCDCCPLFLHGENPLIISALITHSLYAFDTVFFLLFDLTCCSFYHSKFCLSVYTLLSVFLWCFLHLSLSCWCCYFCKSQENAKGITHQPPLFFHFVKI